MLSLRNCRVGVVGLGYVGLPLAVEFGKHFKTVGFDIKTSRIAELRKGKDSTLETTRAELKGAKYLSFTDQLTDLKACRVFIVTVPTPIDEYKSPDLRPLIGASNSVGQVLKKGDVVIYESTVYPGCTEEICIPVLERESKMKWKENFFVGYSPERINPGDREHTLTKIKKVVSGDTPETLDKVAKLYEKIVIPGVYRCSSIKAAEACKVIENTQRDLNISLMNELAIIFETLGIDTTEVLEAAGTKWNFLNFRPGLVGGHCIGVDPYYLTHKAVMMGYHPQVILAGRRINDGMGKYIAEQTIKVMISCGSYVKGARVNILGITFKENCADLRNSKVIDVINELTRYGVEVFVHDLYADPEEALQEYGVNLLSWNDMPRADAIVAAVSHDQFTSLSVEDFEKKLIKGGCFMDVKSSFNAAELGQAGIKVWRL